ncbi:MAG: acyl-CoA dehydrogenase family protein, partial [Acidimicrobiia bacterium]
ELEAHGERAGSAEAFEWGCLANRYPPVLHTHDRYGHRIDEVEFHPAWHHLMEMAVSAGLHCLPWENEGREGSHVARAAMTYLSSQVEAGHWCPISMTYSVVPALRLQPELAAEWEPRLVSRRYDPRCVPATYKTGALMGMGMTEKQGGSDVRANITRAAPINGGGPGGQYSITGHKWFLSAPMCDAFLVLAQTPGGLSCFLLPRWAPDGRRNAINIQRLKDKLGNRSNASAEVELQDAWAVMVGEEGRGVPTIIEMVNGTRLDCVIGSAALMRQAVAQAAHHAAHRSAFGRLLADQPLMRNVLADLAVESEAATLLMMRLAGSFDRREGDPAEAAFSRIATALAKYWVTKRCPAVVGEALECLGGNGYVEESIMPRLYREAPLNSIWEGSGNVIALDVLRAMTRQPAAVEALLAEIDAARGAERRLDEAADRLRARMAGLSDPESEARRVVEEMALALQGSLLVRYGRPEVAEAFAASRLGGDWGRAFGTLPTGLDLQAIIDGATPR